MGNSVNAMHDGFNYQAFWFWSKACALLLPNSDAARVGYEVDQYVAFDDVAVEYRKPVVDKTKGEYLGAFYSIKYSVTYNKELTAQSLGDPELINAQSISLLERLRDAVQKMEASGKNHVFVLLAPWGFKSGDPICSLIDTGSGSVRLEVLFDGTGKRGTMGALRHAWTKQLELRSEEELRPILSRLRIESTPQNVSSLHDRLKFELHSVGLRPNQDSEPVIQYFPLVVAMRKTASWFDAEAIRANCEKQNLLLPRASERPARLAKQLGIRSFSKQAAHLDSAVPALLCVCDEFDERVPKSPSAWSDSLPKRVTKFLQEHLRANEQFDFHLHSHQSIAFLAGYLNEPGLGVSAGIVQRRLGGPPEVWTVDWDEVKKVPRGWDFSVEKIGDGTEFAIAAGITHITRGRVIEHCRTSLLNVGRVLFALPVGGASHTSITSGTHAFALAEQLKNEIATQCDQKTGPLHLFWAGPNAFSFYFGQVSRPLGVCRLYEFDMAEQTYSASLDVSPKLRLETLN